jgi:glucose-6-phosphate 1-dehydrogenase
VKKRQKKPAKQIPSGILKIKISYTPEDGHIGRNMQCKTVKTNTIKLRVDSNITCKTNYKSKTNNFSNVAENLNASERKSNATYSIESFTYIRFFTISGICPSKIYSMSALKTFYEI